MPKEPNKNVGSWRAFIAYQNWWSYSYKS